MKEQLDLAAVIAKLRWLRLPGMARETEAILERARKNNLTPLEIVDALCEEEKNSRIKSAVERRIRGARFAEINTVDGFDFDWDPIRKKVRARYLALHELAFLERAVCPIFIGTYPYGHEPARRSRTTRPGRAGRRRSVYGDRLGGGHRLDWRLPSIRE